MSCPLACAKACFIIDVLRNGYTVPPGRLPGHLEGLPGFLQGLPMILWRCLPCWHLACITTSLKLLCACQSSHVTQSSASCQDLPSGGERGFPCKYLYKGNGIGARRRASRAQETCLVWRSRQPICWPAGSSGPGQGQQCGRYHLWHQHAP